MPSPSCGRRSCGSSTRSPSSFTPASITPRTRSCPTATASSSITPWSRSDGMAGRVRPPSDDAWSRIGPARSTPCPTRMPTRSCRARSGDRASTEKFVLHLGSPHHSKASLQQDIEIMHKVEIRPGVWMAYEDHWFGKPWTVPDTVVMVHGNSESSRAWTAWVPHLAGKYRVIRLDLPGFGASTEPPDYGWRAGELAADLGRFLDALPIETCHLLGAKYGGPARLQRG